MDEPTSVFFKISTVLLLMMSLVLGLYLYFESREVSLLNSQNLESKKELEIQQNLNKTQLKSFNFANDVSEAVHIEKDKTFNNASEVNEKIRDRTKSDICANTLIDDSSVNSLRNFAKSLSE